MASYHEISWTPEKTRRFWDYYGADPRFAELFFGYNRGRFVANMLFKKVRLDQDARILDFSCGYGDVIAACLPLMRAGQRIHATDFSDGYVHFVRERFAKEPRFGGAQVGSAVFERGSFDVVCATEVLEHLQDHELDAALVECRRLLSHGGKVFFTTPNNENYDIAKIPCPECGCVFHRWQHVRTWNKETLRDRIEGAGFVTEFVDPVCWLNWKGQLLERIRRQPLQYDTLVYIGHQRDQTRRA